jgi:uncharacterized cupin superfamily protein
VPTIHTNELYEADGYRRARLAEQAGADRLGLTVYELPPGTGMHFHYHLQREELLVVLEGTVALRTTDGWEDVPAGEVRAFPRGERGVHGYENRSELPVRLLMFRRAERAERQRLSGREPGRDLRRGEAGRAPVRRALRPRRRGRGLRRRKARGGCVTGSTPESHRRVAQAPPRAP